MRIKALLITALALLGLSHVENLSAQETAVQWEGHTPESLLGGSGTEVFLYNVGTGRFIIHGGDWGVQVRLFNNDTGKTLKLQYGSSGNIVFNTGMSTEGACVLGCNVPNVTSQGGWGSDNTFTILMDANESYTNNNTISGTRNWHFVRVEDSGNTDTYTYYLYETLNGTNYYMGANYGYNSNDHEGDPNGELVLLSSSYDKAVWTTVNPLSSTTYSCGLKSAEKRYLGDVTSVDRSMDTEVRIYGGIDIELRKLYQWRLVTKEELLNLATQDNDGGLSINLTYLIEDRGFERNDYSFFDSTDGWVAKPFANAASDFYTTTGEGRYRYTWGFLNGSGDATGSSKTNNQAGTRTVANQNYRYPVRLKTQWDTKNDAKYGYMEFEGAGTVYTPVPLPKKNGSVITGVYKVSGYGFYRNGGSEDHPAYLFATTTDPSTLSASDLQSASISKLEQVTNDYDKSISGEVTSNNGTYTKTGVMGGGYDFVWTIAQGGNKETLRREVEINVGAGVENIYLGVCKFEATKSDVDDTSGGTTQYYITYTENGTTYYLNSSGRFVSNTKTAWETNNYGEVHSGDVYLYYSTSGNTRYLTTTTYTGLGQNYGVRVNGQNRLYVGNTYYLIGNSSGATPNFSTSTTNAASWTSENSGGTSYYHDTDWVGADQFEITYLGTDPVMFDEDEESLDYLKDNGSDKQYTNQSIRLHREFVTKDWNTFVFPLDLSSDQVRNAFGDNTLLAELVDLGLYTRRADCVDFEIKPMASETMAVKAGKLYLVKPENGPLHNNEGVPYYDFGRKSFNTSDFQGIETIHINVAEGDDIQFREGHTDGVTTYACYYRTTGYESISGNKITNTAAITNGVYVPKHSYVIGQDTSHGGAKMYWTANDLKVKGFRGWLVDGDKTGSSTGAKFYLGGIFDENEATSIGFVQVGDSTSGSYHTPSTGIFDLSGRRVAAIGEENALPKGMYIVNGKKFIVK